MNHLYSIITCVGVMFFAASIASFAEAPPFHKDTPIKIIGGGNKPRSHPKFLTAIKNRLLFVQAGEGFPAKPGGSGLSIDDCNSSFVVDGTALRVRIVPPEGHPKKTLSKKLLDMDGWYVTADYSTRPPTIVLTEKPTENSRWQFIAAPATPNEGHCYFVMNQNSQQKDVWLSMEEDDKTFSRGYLRNPFLSSKRTDYFRIVYDDTDGSK